MLDQILRMLFALWADDFSRLFSILIFGYFVFALRFINTTNTKRRALVLIAPGAMTSLGILGTFTGVFLGLLDFDIRTIDRSLPMLLEGLKVAFGTSILGLFAAVLFRVISPLIASENVGGEDASATDIVEKLAQIEVSINAGFETLRNALTDDNDSSIAGQLQRLRTRVGDGFDDQIKEFRTFAEHMSKAFSEAIIDELKVVIREFNEKISEQFGENFKQLNEAVGRLVDWLDEYKQQMSALKIAIDHAVEGIKESQKALSDIEASASKIPNHLTKMEQANSVLSSQLEKIAESLGGFAEMRDKATDAFPEIQKNIENITGNLSSTVEHQTGVVKEIATKYENLISLQKESIDDQRIVQREMLEGLQTSFNETIQSTNSKMNDAIVQLDEAMQNEIESVIRTMAENLSGIAEQFVKDYTPLVEATRRVVELGDRTRQDE